MKITYLCDRCGAVIGSMIIEEEQLEMLGLDPLTVDLQEDIIKSTETGELFIYSICQDCVDTMYIHESDLPFRSRPDHH